MDEDETWLAGRLRPRKHCVRWRPSCPYGKGHTNLRARALPASVIRGPCLLWPNGWMDQAATWYGVRPRSRPHCVRWGPSFPPNRRGHISARFSAHVYCGQTAGSIKMSLGTQVGLGPGEIVLDVDPAPPDRGTAAPTFLPMSLMAKRSPISATAEL